MAEAENAALLRDEVVVIETNLDDVTGELLGWLMDRLLAAGALDVGYIPMQMKKNRPATLVRVIARPQDAERLARMLVRDTPTLGVRLQPMERRIAARREEQLESPLGSVRVKLKLFGTTIVSAAPEYADCQQIATTTGLPLADVMARIDAWLRERYALS